jgi:hypothetical protein
MIERQSSEIEYRQGRLMAEAANRRLSASKVDVESGRVTRGHSRRAVAGLVAAVLRNLGVFVVLCVALLVSGCSTAQAVAPSAPSAPLATAPMEAPAAAASPDGPVSPGTNGGPGRSHQQ